MRQRNITEPETKFTSSRHLGRTLGSRDETFHRWKIFQEERTDYLNCIFSKIRVPEPQKLPHKPSSAGKTACGKKVFFSLIFDAVRFIVGAVPHDRILLLLMRVVVSRLGSQVRGTGIRMNDTV